MDTPFGYFIFTILALAWFGIATLVGKIGRRHEIGFDRARVISLLLTPIVGLIVTLWSQRLPGQKYSVELSFGIFFLFAAWVYAFLALLTAAYIIDGF